LTPAQLEEFEAVFRHFDRDQTNTLGAEEFSAALSGLGIVFSVRQKINMFLFAPP
jgi:Ca2+-binding EF-hand superfamily protein